MQVRQSAPTGPRARLGLVHVPPLAWPTQVCKPTLLGLGKGQGEGLATDRQTDAGNAPVQGPEPPPEARLPLEAPGPQSSHGTALLLGVRSGVGVTV